MRNRRCHLARSALSGLMLVTFLGACSTTGEGQTNRSHAHAFIVYWPPKSNSGQLRLAVKDIIDMKGVVTTAGSEYLAKTRPPASQDAECLNLARERQVQIVGKTNLTEFAAMVSGKNRFFGTPENRLDGKHKVIPGGSSSGSAVAVATGMADVAFGTDTAGSIRNPAACCGICGLKTTFGLVSTKGVFPISPGHMDTVGPMARDMAHLVQGMDLLQRGFATRYHDAVAARPSAASIKIGRLYLDGTDPDIDKALDEALAARHFKVIKLDQRFKAKWDQAEKDGKAVALAEVWLHDREYAHKREVGSTTKAIINQGERDYANNYKDALKRQAAWRRELRRTFEKVDLIALPTMQKLPPRFPFFGSSIVFEWLVFNMQNTAAVNFAGNPALALPVPMPAKGKTAPVTSLQLVGRRLGEAELLNAGRLVEFPR